MGAGRFGRSRGYGPYEPLRSGRTTRRHPPRVWPSAWLRTAILGPLGWLALGAAILGVGLALAYVASRAGLPPLGGFAVGGLGVLLAVMVADRVKWARMTTAVGFNPPAGSGGAEALADEIRRAFQEAGVAAEVSVATPAGPTPEMIAAGHPDRPGAGPSLQVSYRHIDRREVDRVLRGLGVPAPHLADRRQRYRDTGR